MDIGLSAYHRFATIFGQMVLKLTISLDYNPALKLVLPILARDVLWS